MVREAQLIFNKKYICPVCGQEFLEKTIKNGKTRLLPSDYDLRPRYEGIDPLKYEVIACPHCGYAALIKFFSELTDSQIAKVKKIEKKIKLPENQTETYQYPDVILRYKSALLHACIKQGRLSEQAYICLKIAWVIRGYCEEILENGSGLDDQIKHYEEEEQRCLLKAYEGFLTARQKEHFPICGMDENTLEYLLAALAIETKNYDTAQKFISSILTSKFKSERIKDRTRDLKEILTKQLEENKLG